MPSPRPSVTLSPSVHFHEGAGHLDVRIEGLTVGAFVIQKASRRRLHISMLIVEKRRQGVGRAAVSALLAWAREQGFLGARLDSNDTAVGFWTKMGFTPVRTARQPGDLVPMALNFHNQLTP